MASDLRDPGQPRPARRVRLTDMPAGEEPTGALETYAGDHGHSEAFHDSRPMETLTTFDSRSDGLEPPALDNAAITLSRYDDLGLLGKGGMGEVRRVYDRKLGRVLALKTLHLPALKRPMLMSRFLEEAQATAQLQHPGIVPIHDMGRLSDGRYWFTMKEVTGRTLRAVIEEVHAASKLRWESTASGWSLHRLVDALRRVCEAMAYAHERGVIHRDLKPQNIMVGSNDEVVVMDWGLARVGRLEVDPKGLPTAGPVSTARSRQGHHTTLDGQVQGTPAYMPPEQACGNWSGVDGRSDVYSLGAILYEILAGHAPYRSGTAEAVLGQVRAGPPAPLRHSGPVLPQELVDVCEVAMAREPSRRYPAPAALALELDAWLSGSRRREQALLLVQQALAKEPQIQALRNKAGALRMEAAEWAARVESWQPETHKIPGWVKESEAVDLERQADLMALQKDQLLHASLTHMPDLPEAHAELARSYRAEHAAAEDALRLTLDAHRFEALLRHHLAALSPAHPDHASHLEYLEGDGSLTLLTEPSGARVTLHRQELRHRRLVSGEPVVLGHTPLRKTSLPMGSYVCIIEHPDCQPVRYPVLVGRGEHWDGVAPGEDAPTPIRLPSLGELQDDDCFMPPGWFQCGGDTGVQNSLPKRRVWVDGMVVRRFPVTNRDYLAFLQDLVAQGRVDEALRFAPRERSGKADEQGPLLYDFDGARFCLGADTDGDLWELDWPVVMVDWLGARAFADWMTAQTGQPWSLPPELAWEKAARGVDGRLHPWGDGFDPSWACMRESHEGKALPVAVRACPIDESVYGVRGLGGNVRDWCQDDFTSTGPVDALQQGPSAAGAPIAEEPTSSLYRVCRGGNWNGNAQHIRSTNRFRGLLNFRSYVLGFRLVRPLD